MLVDLAASESSKRTSSRFQQLEECKFINLSLSALGNCVAALAKVCAASTHRISSRPTRASQGAFYLQLVGGARGGECLAYQQRSHVCMCLSDTSIPPTIISRIPSLIFPFCPCQRQAHVPYRDSKLTRLLTQSLGGNSKTALIVGLLPERYT